MIPMVLQYNMSPPMLDDKGHLSVRRLGGALGRTQGRDEASQLKFVILPQGLV